MNSFSQKTIDEKLSLVFGFSSFRPGQEDIVETVLSGRDLFAVMPTGGGKSLCYQLPAVLLSGTAVVVSPLISLMKDQVDGARANGIEAAYLNSTLSENEKRDVQGKLIDGKLDLLYIAPERLGQSGFMSMLLKCNISLFAIDEAHCISEWGHDFRPDYLILSELVSAFKKIPIIAFTASATKEVQNDIVNKLNLRNPYIHRASFDRPNLFIEVKPKKDLNSSLIEFIKKRSDDSGIIYRTTRKSVEETAEILKGAGINALPYHAGLEDRVRHEYQENFNKDKISVIVATIAFGMGIDKSNVRYVIHGDLPKNIEGYYQEIGRAGRDGELAHCTLFYSRGDIAKQRYFIDQAEDDSERQRLLLSLNKMSSYAGLNICRRKQILEYFNEDYEKENCGNCDVCIGSTEKTDVTIEAQKLLSTVIRAGNRFGGGYVVDILLGAESKKILDRGHDKLSCYAIGKDRDRSFWLNLIDNLIALGYLYKTDDRYPVLQCNQSSRSLLKGEEKVSIIIHEQKEGRHRRKQKSSGGGTVNPALFAILRRLRLKLAEEQKVPPFVIFSDATLREMSDLIPKTSNDLIMINGIGEKKMEKYGDLFLKEIEKWHSENPNALKAELKNIESVKVKIAPGETYKVTLEFLKQGKSIKEIAQQRELSVSTIEGHIAKLIEDGEEIDTSNILSEEKYLLIQSLVESLKTERLKAIVEAGDSKISYGEVRVALALMKVSS